MMPGATIASSGEITLITLQNCSASISFLLEISEKIAALKMNVDMVFLSPIQRAFTSLSLTVADEDLGRMLQFTSKLQIRHEIKMIVSSGSSKITVNDQCMKYIPGIAAAIFATAARASTDMRIITTPEDEVSLLVTSADYPETLTAIEQVMREPQD